MGLALIIICCALGGIGSLACKSSYKKWSKVQSGVPITGAQMAARMIEAAGEREITINVIQGTMSDYFDPTNRTLNLSSDVANGTSVAAHAIACHEAGHYLQFCQGYAPLKLRHAMVPAVNVTSSLCWIVFFAALFLQLLGLIWVAAALYCVSILFSLVTLPVEFNASRRAVAFLSTPAACTPAAAFSAPEVKGSKAMLRSAALTYVMSTLASIINLLYILLVARG